MTLDEFELEETSRGSAPADELDVYAELLRSQVSDEWLELNNLGTGHYEDSEMWQQVESYSHGLHAEAALSRTILERAIAHAKEGVALNGFEWETADEEAGERLYVEGWRHLPEEERERLDRRRWFDHAIPKKWERLPVHARVDAIKEHGGLSDHYETTPQGDFEPAYTSPFHRMVAMRHEASRSRDARLLDNITGRVRKLIKDATEGAKDSLFRRN